MSEVSKAHELTHGGRASCRSAAIRKRISTCALGLIVFVSPVAVAQDRGPSLAPHGINLRGSDGTTTSSTVLSFDCSYPWEGQPSRINYSKVTCRFATTGIARPSAEQIAQRLAELDAPENQKDLRDKFPRRCEQIKQIEAQLAMAPLGPERRYFEMLSKACAEGDVPAGKEALRYNINAIWANTCTIFNYGAREYDFVKVNESTWRSMDASATGRSATIKTIWRKGTTGWEPWNYKQVTSADPACAPAPFRECEADSNDEWSHSTPVTLTACQFFD